MSAGLTSAIGAVKDQTVRFRPATPADGRVVHRLIRESGGLELNTEYAYVLLCDHFASTTVVAETNDQVVGFVAAYVPPLEPDAVFVWQVGVHPSARGLGVASLLLDALVARPACRSVRFLKATVAPSNAASRRLFESFARRRGAPFAWSDGYPSSLFEAAHEPENLIRIGPIDADSSTHPSQGRTDS